MAAAEPQTKLTTPAQISDLAWEFRRSRVLLSAFELGLFSALGDEALAAAEVAAKLQTDPRATDRLLAALVGLGLVEKTGGRYSNSELAASHLVRGRPGFMAGLGHSVQTWNNWHHLTESVRTGQSACAEEMAERPPGYFKNFIKAMHARAGSYTVEMVELIDPGPARRMLDVGGGSGVFSIALAKAVEGLTAVVLDLPEVTALAQEYIAAEGLTGRVTTLAGDYDNPGDWGSGYDLILLSDILHINNPEQNQKLISHCAGLLAPGGKMVISEFGLNEDRTEPAFAALFALNMLTGTKNGDTYTGKEMSAWMVRAGLTNPEIKWFKSGKMMVQAVKEF